MTKTTKYSEAIMQNNLMSNSDLLYCCMPLTPINRHQELQFKHRPLGEEYLPEALTIPPLPSTYLYPFIKL